MGGRVLRVEGAPVFLSIHVPESLFLRVGGDPVCMRVGAYGLAVGRDRGNSRSAREQAGRWSDADLGSPARRAARHAFPAPPVLSQASLRGCPAGVAHCFVAVASVNPESKKKYYPRGFFLRPIDFVGAFKNRVGDFWRKKKNLEFQGVFLRQIYFQGVIFTPTLYVYDSRIANSNIF